MAVVSFPLAQLSSNQWYFALNRAASFLRFLGHILSRGILSRRWTWTHNSWKLPWRRPIPQPLLARFPSAPLSFTMARFSPAQETAPSATTIPPHTRKSSFFAKPPASLATTASPELHSMPPSNLAACAPARLFRRALPGSCTVPMTQKVAAFVPASKSSPIHVSIIRSKSLPVCSQRTAPLSFSPSSPAAANRLRTDCPSDSTWSFRAREKS